MKFVDEYRDNNRAKRYLDAIHEQVTHPWTLMEICGGQTHGIVKYGIDQLLPNEITLVHGPGCPVCVTPVGMIDKAIDIALREDVILATFGDMARVPGSTMSLLSAKAKGADVRVVYSPLNAVQLARENPERQVVFFAVGFETTAPVSAMSVLLASREELSNFSLLVSHVLVPAAMEAILSSPEQRIQGFLAAGHVCTVMGTTEYTPLVEKYRIPIVVTGFEPVDILQGIHACVQQLECGKAELDNQYARVVRDSGNQQALSVLQQVFEVGSRQWRGIGDIADSGLRFAQAFAQFDAEQRFGAVERVSETDTGCISGQVLQGLQKPMDCPNFGVDCTPENPLGAPMVSSEGACAAYHMHRQHTIGKPDSTQNNYQPIKADTIS